MHAIWLQKLCMQHRCICIMGNPCLHYLAPLRATLKEWNNKTADMQKSEKSHFSLLFTHSILLYNKNLQRNKTSSMKANRKSLQRNICSRFAVMTSNSYTDTLNRNWHCILIVFWFTCYSTFGCLKCSGPRKNTLFL